MAVITTDDAWAEDDLEGDRQPLFRLEGPDFSRAFVERLVATAQQIAARDRPGSEIPDVNWDSIWAAGDGAPSVERAVGSIVTAAFTAARDIAGGSAELLELLHAGSELRRASSSTVGDESRQPVLDPVTEPITIERELQSAVPWIPASPETEEQTVSAPQVDFAPLSPVARPTVLSASRWFSRFTWVRNIGVVVLLFVAWQLWGTAIAQHHAQDQLRSSFEASVHAHQSAAGSSTTEPTLIAADEIVPGPPEGSEVAQLQVPAIGINQIVVMGTAPADLAKGPGHYVGTAMPGQAGNVAIAGHRTTNGAPFNRLGQLVKGDQIYLTTSSGERLDYSVAGTPTPVSPSDVAVLNDFGDNRITLTTCNPEFSASQRLIAVGKLVTPVILPTAPNKPTTYHIVDPATASWGWKLFPLVLLELAALVLLGLGNRRLTGWYGRGGRWLILVPVWAAGLYLLFQSLTAFLPATL